MSDQSSLTRMLGANAKDPMVKPQGSATDVCFNLTSFNNINELHTPAVFTRYAAMDEVENPALPSAGETSPTLRPVDEDDDDNENTSPTKPTIDTTSSFPDDDSNNSPGFVNAPAHLPLPSSRRPPLNREPSNPAAPPTQPPPPPPPPPSTNFPEDAPDSLTLADLKRLRSSFPPNGTNPSTAENGASALPPLPPPPKENLLDCDSVYDFTYQDAQSLPVELEEWFSYAEEELEKLRGIRVVFDEVWRNGGAATAARSPPPPNSTEASSSAQRAQDWLDVTEDARRAFLKSMCGVLAAGAEAPISRDGTGAGSREATEALMVLTYVGLGVWEETAGKQGECGLEEMFGEAATQGGGRLGEYKTSALQVQWIVAMVDALHACGGLEIIYKVLRRTIEVDFRLSAGEVQGKRPEESHELWCCLTLMYVFVEVARTTTGQRAKELRDDITALQPSLLTYFTEIVAKLRWDENAPIPLTKMLLLSWKTMVVCLGGIKDVEHVKASLAEDQDEVDTRGKPVITASPLDYHLFRQEIGSKYPAYQPPPPLFPLEPESNSILPPLKHRTPSFASNDTTYSFAGASNIGTPSIMHQPVHIATPAPSPPPSPAGPGKAGKKQNYQTNQMFPFLYPPLDAGSNDLGGKGSTELQDALVGRKWAGSDIPTSIIEAAELFAKRMRATRAMKQMWEARVDFMKCERGWKPSTDVDPEFDDFELVDKAEPVETAEQGEPLAQTPEQNKLDMVQQFYHDSLPHLQSWMIVVLKVVMQNVTDLVTKGNGQNGLQAGIQFNDTNGMNGSTKPMENGMPSNGDSIENTSEELDKLRSQEIATKALSAMILLLLKWFKVSHILQYEYMTQLLLDANYVPLILKVWQTQDIGRICHYRLESPELNFFHFCCENSGRASPKAINGSRSAADESEDEAIPPPIRLRRDDPENPLSPSSPRDLNHAPEVDELGYPQTPLPPSPIKNYSYRNVFTAINYLRILQKVTRRKTYRALQLVQYKSSNHLRKTLKIPIRLLRYYTLKIYKSQVPFCGRKWRQANMKVITTVWLSVPAELRDDWLSGGGGGMGGACVGDVDGTVEDSLPLEESLRSLTHWWNVRHFPDVMGVDRGLLEEEADFFVRELEKMDFGLEPGAGEAELSEEQLAAEGGEGWQGPIEGY